jgi:type IV pilus assembly protein PilB
VTSADDFVLQLIQDKGLVKAEAVASARQKVKADTPSDQVDSAILDILVQDERVTEEQVMKTLAD